MSLFEISPVNETPEEEAERLKSQDPGFMAGAPVSEELGPDAPPLNLTGEGNVKPAAIPSSDALAKQAQADAAAKLASQAERYTASVSAVNDFFGAQGSMTDTLTAYDTVVNTAVKDMKDVSSIDLSSTITADLFDFAAAGLPDPADFGLNISDIVDLTSVDMTTWNLPLPKLGIKNDKCWTLDDIMAGLCDDLDSYDARNEALPPVDYSDPKFDSFDFPDYLNGSRSVPLKDVADVSSLSLCDPLDLMDIDWPDFDLPNIGNPLGALDLSGFMDTIGGFIGDMSMDGDLINLGALSGVISGIKCAGALIVDILVPDAVSDALSNFNIPGWDENPDTVDDAYKDVFNNMMYMVSDDWIWYDKDRGIYNFDNLSRVSSAAISMMESSSNNDNLTALSKALRLHRITIG